MIVIIFVQVVLRYCFGTTISWGEELTRYIMLYQIWIGAAYAVKEDAHLRITTFRDKFSKKKFHEDRKWSLSSLDGICCVHFCERRRTGGFPDGSGTAFAGNAAADVGSIYVGASGMPFDVHQIDSETLSQHSENQCNGGER